MDTSEYEEAVLLFKKANELLEGSSHAFVHTLMWMMDPVVSFYYPLLNKLYIHDYSSIWKHMN